MDRRTALFTGLGVLAAAALPRRLAHAQAGSAAPAAGDPVATLPSLGSGEVIGGLPFSPRWYGDVFRENALPFHNCEDCDGRRPAADEVLDVAIVGGGLSGLATAHALRDRRVALFDLRPRFGGNAMGERWRGLQWSLGSAYFMSPDRGSRLAELYTELGVDSQVRVDESPLTFEWESQVTAELAGPRATREELAQVAAYRARVAYYANDAYPDIPFDGAPSRELAALDAQNFQTALEEACGGPLPARLAYALQAYCYSSFGVGMQELSAAAGWNFVAAEEFGRWILPGGNSGLARALWRTLAREQQRHGTGGLLGGTAGGPLLRPGATVTTIDRHPEGALVRWRDDAGRVHRSLARHVVLANAKHIARHMMPWLEKADPEKFEAMEQVPTVAYVVANVILSRPVPPELYDLFLGGDASYPMNDYAFSQRPIIADAVNGTFADRTLGPGAVLTLYWPLPWHTARFTIVQPEQWRDYATMGAPQIAHMLSLVGIAPSDVLQVRLTRWGHAMPYARPGSLSGGLPAALRRPIDGRIWFANQDNWLLPAVETCLLEGFAVADKVRGAL